MVKILGLSEKLTAKHLC